MNDQIKKPTPSFRGLSWYREQYFSFYIPIGWHKLDYQDERNGIIFVPSTEDTQTLFAVEVIDLGTVVTADDVTYIYDAFLDAIKQLSQRKIEQKKQAVTGKLVQLEAKYTYEEDEQTRKRWVRVLYNDTRQVTVTAQGSTVEAFDYWLPMFFEAMMTVNVHKSKPAAPVE